MHTDTKHPGTVLEIEDIPEPANVPAAIAKFDEFMSGLDADERSAVAHRLLDWLNGELAGAVR